MRRRSRALLPVPLLMLTLAACTGESDDDAGGMDHGDTSMSMNDPEATPADQAEGETASGAFVLLDTAPPDSDFVAGDAYLAQNDDGTTVTIRLTGLAPSTEYLAHLHEKPCNEDNGGDHFAFDPDGPEVPPNEVHLAFTSDDFGAGEATVTNDDRVGDGARSVVVHPADSMDNRLACAGF